MITPALVPAIVMFGIGATAATVLAIAAKVFFVEVDPRITEVEEALPGANCGGCGYTGCTACAEAMVAGKAPLTACTAGGPDTAAKVARVLGGTVGFVEPKIARHRCTGGDRAARKFNYEGAKDCRVQYALHGGDLQCKTGCLGGGTCIEVCSFGALKMGEDNLPEVITGKCTGCGKCESVCPTGVITVRTTTEHILHHNNNHECIAPCSQLCPAQIDIPGYVELASKGKFAEAVALIKERNPLPLICGRVCPAPCENGCRRAMIEDEPVHHNYIKRFVADWEAGLPEAAKPPMLPDSGKRVAIVGGGPCGLSAAYYLRIMGHHPVILDAKPALGGMLRYGIPEYRLPKAVLDREINQILQLGVDVKYDAKMGTDYSLNQLREEYDAVLLAMGAWDNSEMRCEGEDLPGVWGGTTFLQKKELGIDVDLLGKRVVVVGGGNTAMDAARSSVRMGAAEVVLLYRRTRNEMPANRVEIDAAEHEGIIYKLLAAPTRLLPGPDGNVAQLEYITMELGEPDASGRRSPVPIKDSETIMDVDVVIKAIGQRPLKDWWTDECESAGLKITRWNTIEADEMTLQAKGVPDVFTGGDIFTGPALLIDAVGAGRRAARGIHMFVTGQSLDFPDGTFKGPKKQRISHDVEVTGVGPKEKVVQPELPAEERIKTFEEVDLVVTPELMAKEAARCMRCGTLCFYDDHQWHEREREKELSEKVVDKLAISPS